MKKDITNRFVERFSGVPQFVTDFELFREVSEGDVVAVLFNSDKELYGFFEKRVERNGYQEVYLQHEADRSSSHPEARRTRVVKYKLPLKGEVEFKHFEKGVMETYFLD